MIITMLIKRKKIIISLWELNGSSFEQTWIPFTQRCNVAGLVEIGPVVLEKKIFLMCQCIFAILLLSPFGKGRGPSFEQTWIPFIPRMLYAKFGWNWSSGSRGEDFFFVNVFSLFRNYLPLEMGGALHLNKLWSPLPKDALC